MLSYYSYSYYRTYVLYPKISIKCQEILGARFQFCSAGPRLELPGLGGDLKELPRRAGDLFPCIVEELALSEDDAALIL